MLPTIRHRLAGLVVVVIALFALMTLRMTPPNLTVMTYNLRLSAALDGENSWDNRKAALVGVIKIHNPDILGVQEAMPDQIDFLRRSLPDYDMVGVGRDDGIRGGEVSSIFYRRSELGIRESGTRWISSTPDVPGSKGPGANLPRVFTWAVFTHRSGREFLAINTHLDHESKPARALGAQQIREFAARYHTLPAVVMGDFNCSDTSPPVQAMLAGGSFRLAKPTEGPYGTFNHFDPSHTDGPMIDHILVTPQWQVGQVHIDRTTYDNKVPSDHFPVVARLTLP